jgi:hypothetical protein
LPLPERAFNQTPRGIAQLREHVLQNINRIIETKRLAGGLMQTWIFQGNPDDFDIDGYLASRPSQVFWLVTRYASEIAPGDRVYLWRNQGQAKAVAGIIAETIVSEAPTLRGEDTEGVSFWREASERSTAPQIRAVLRLIRVASPREILRRDWMLDDPILKDLPNLRMQAGTNYKLSREQADRLDALWSRTGRDWSRDEALAGLWAYNQTYGQAVSKLATSPVADVALRIGRAVSGVYAKVMNFRSIDPRVPGEGMSAANWFGVNFSMKQMLFFGRTS